MNRKLFGRKTWPTNRRGNIFQKDFALFGGLDTKFRLFLIQRPTTITEKQIVTSLLFFSFFQFFKMHIETIKESKHLLITVQK